jgi:hypothetical protein
VDVGAGTEEERAGQVEAAIATQHHTCILAAAAAITAIARELDRRRRRTIDVGVCFEN